MITKEQENEFNRIVDCLRTQGDIDCLLDMIPDETKKQFIEEWHESQDYDKKDELMQEALQELRDEPFHTWKDDNRATLEEDFIKSFPPEEQPLDDDTPDFLDRWCDDFDEFARDIFNKSDIKGEK